MVRFDPGEGLIVELTDEQFIRLLAALVGSYTNFAENYIHNHLSGLADFDGVYYKKTLSQIQLQYTTIDVVISDGVLLDSLHSLLNCLRRLEDNDDKIVHEYASYFRLESPDSDIGRKKLKKAVYTSRVQNVDVPNSVLEVAKESETIFSSIRDLRKSIEERINTLLVEGE